MPITQVRMLAIISAGEDLMTGIKTAVLKGQILRDNQIQTAFNNLSRLGVTADDPIGIETRSISDAFNQLLEDIDAIITSKVVIALGTERAHFKARASSNDAGRKYHQNRRKGETVPIDDLDDREPQRQYVHTRDLEPEEIPDLDLRAQYERERAARQAAQKPVGGLGPGKKPE